MIAVIDASAGEERDEFWTLSSIYDGTLLQK